MPNWCNNIIAIQGDVKNIQEIAKVIETTIKEDSGNYLSVSEIDILKGRIILRGDTAWSPPLEFCSKLAKKYKVSLRAYYEEPGNNFCGQADFDEGGLMEDARYGFDEGFYLLNGFNEWFDCQIQSLLELSLRTKLDNSQDKQRVVKNNLPFLSDYEVQQVVEEYEKNK